MISRNFSRRLLKKNTYPPYTTDDFLEIVLKDNMGSVLYQTHDFDKPQDGERVKKWCKDDINHGNLPLCGLLPL